MNISQLLTRFLTWVILETMASILLSHQDLKTTFKIWVVSGPSQVHATIQVVLANPAGLATQAKGGLFGQRLCP